VTKFVSVVSRTILVLPVTAATVQRLEEIILSRARDLRRSASAG
jgi:hypothetical protein